MRSDFFQSKCRFAASSLLIAVLGFGTASARADSSPPPGNHDRTSATPTHPPPWAPGAPLTMEQALRRALVCDGRVASLKAAMEVARQERLAATDIKDPEVEGQIRSRGQAFDGGTGDLEDGRVRLDFFVPNPWLVLPRVDARTADYKAVQADLSAAIWLVRSEVQRLFAQLGYLTNDLAFSADEVRFNGEVLNAMQARLKQGAATASDLMTASRQYLQFQNELDQTYHRYQQARRQLAALLDIPPESFELATNEAPPSLMEPALDFQQVEAMADRSRYDLTALRWRAQAAQSTYHEIYNQRWPWITKVEGGNQYKSDQYFVGLAMDVPIFSWTKNHAAAAALAKVGLAGVDETNGFKLVRQELHDALDEVDQTRRQQVRNDANVEPLIATMRQALATLKASPNVMPEQVAAAELQLVETLRFDLDTRWQYQLALMDLERVLGAPLSQKNSGATSP
ncbi:MAG: TolC family protein [Verrucomicrobiota bacterium]